MLGALGVSLLMVAAPAALAQFGTDPSNPGSGTITVAPSRSAPPATMVPATPAAPLPIASAAGSGLAPATRTSTGPIPMPSPVPAPSAGPLPPDPFTSSSPVVFGSQMFSGRFSSSSFSGFNAEYQVAVGDQISIRMWGAFPFDSVQVVDAQGNVFIPNVGPIKVLGVRNAELNRQVEAQVKRVFRANVGVYAALEGAQPVKVYVTGFVRAPGLYSGLSADSVLAYLDRAGGIDPDRGSFLEVEVIRGGQTRERINLYRFLLEGQIKSLQLQDGDTIVAASRRHTVRVSGEVLNPYIFEFGSPRINALDLMAMARPRPGATHMAIVRKIGADRRSEYQPLSDAASIVIDDGDEVTFTSDKIPGTILVRVDGAHLGPRSLVMPYGATFTDAIDKLKPSAQANMAAVQLFRRSVAQRQRERLDVSLRSLETYALTPRSATSEESVLRGHEAELILQFIDRARSVQPKGQVMLAQKVKDAGTLLEDGDQIVIPERSNLILVSGEVMFPNALVWESGRDAEAYVARAGGYTQDSGKDQLVVLRQDGSVAERSGEALQPGDEVLVLPKVQSKNIEVTRAISQIIYQIAIAAKVAFGLF